MKKLLALVVLFTTVYTTTVNAQQNNNNQPTKVESYREFVKPGLIEKTQLSEAVADKVIAIQYSYSGRMRKLSTIADEQQRTTQINALTEAQNKEFSAIPLTETQIKAVNKYFEAKSKEIAKRFNYEAPDASGN